RLRKIKFFQRLHSWQLGIADAIGDRMTVALLTFQRKQCLQIPDVGMVFLHGLLAQGNKVRSNRRRPDGLAILPHAGVFERFSRAFHWITPLHLSSRSYASITGSGRSNWASSSDSSIWWRRRSSAPGVRIMCNTAA